MCTITIANYLLFVDSNARKRLSLPGFPQPQPQQPIKPVDTDDSQNNNNNNHNNTTN